MSIYDKSSLVLIPSGTKTGKVYSQKPVSGDGDFTFSRSTAATRVNADGNIEKETQNLLTYSNTFSSWTFSNASVTSGHSGYDGTTDAWELTKSAGSGRTQQTISTSGVQTYSVYAKAGTYDWALLLITTTSGDRIGYFDLANGVVGTGFSLIDSSIESVGGGWYRCTIVFTASTTTARVYPALSNTNLGTSGSIYIQDAQLEQGLVARDYIETTTSAVEGGITDNVPRLDYTDSSCPALLLEPQRTNIFLTSEWFGVWDLNAGTTLTYNYATSPEGVQNAARYVGTGASGFGDKFTLTSGTQYTISAYVKSNTGATQYCRLIGDSSNISSDLEVTTEWTRIDYTWTSGGLANKTNGIFRDSSNNDIDILVYGLQLEAGSYATSYIPTYGSSVTRGAELCSKSGISSLIGQTEGTLFFEFEEDGNTDYSIARGLSISDGTYDNRIYLSRLSNGAIYVTGSVSGSAVIELQEPTPSSRTKVKAALAYSNNDYVLYVNGSQKATDTSGGVPSCSNLYLGQEIGLEINSLKKPYNQALVFKTRLSNAELADLTTL